MFVLFISTIGKMACELDNSNVKALLIKGNLKTLHDVLGKQKFKTPIGSPPSLTMQLRTHITNNATFNMANNVTTHDPIDAAEKLLKREYPQIENPDSATFIPECFIPHLPIRIDKLEPHHELEIQKFYGEEQAKKMGGKGKKGKKGTTASTTIHQDWASQFNKNLGRSRDPGDTAERTVYKQLENLFNNDKQNASDAIVVHGLHIGGKDVKKQLGIEEQETDFVLFLPKRKLIVPIEVKTTLGDNQQVSASKQLQRNMEVLQVLFYDLLNDGDWNFCPTAFFLNNCSAKLCSECDKYTLSTNEDFKTWWNEVKRLFPNVAVDEQEQKKIRRKMLDVVRLLLFTIHMHLPITKTRSVEKIVEMVQKIGDPQNILFWSAIQYQLITTETQPLVLFKAGYGAGKSILMQTKCEELARKGIKIVYIVGGKKNKKPTLLHLKLKNKWENSPDISIKSNIMLRGYNDIVVSKEAVIKYII